MAGQFIRYVLPNLEVGKYYRLTYAGAFAVPKDPIKVRLLEKTPDYLKLEKEDGTIVVQDTHGIRFMDKMNKVGGRRRKRVTRKAHKSHRKSRRSCRK